MILYMHLHSNHSPEELLQLLTLTFIADVNYCIKQADTDDVGVYVLTTQQVKFQFHTVLKLLINDTWHQENLENPDRKG